MDQNPGDKSKKTLLLAGYVLFAVQMTGIPAHDLKAGTFAHDLKAGISAHDQTNGTLEHDQKFDSFAYALPVMTYAYDSPVMPVFSIPAYQDTLHLESGELRLVVVNNESCGSESDAGYHRAGYNGIAELYVKNGEEKNFFRPDVSGLNYEFLFSGDSASYYWDIFEPRRAPMQLMHLKSDSLLGIKLNAMKNKIFKYDGKNDGHDCE